MTAFKVGDVVFVMARIKAFDDSPTLGEVAVLEPFDCEKKPMVGEWLYLPSSAMVLPGEMARRVAVKIGVQS